MSNLFFRQGAASEGIVPVSIKAHLSTVPEEAFEVIYHDAPTKEEPLKYHAVPFRSSRFWTVSYRRERALVAAGAFKLI